MITLPSPVTDFMNTVRTNGFEVYVVGGAVRNLLLNKEVTNWDFTTNAAPENIQKIFPDNYWLCLFRHQWLKRQSGIVAYQALMH